MATKDDFERMNSQLPEAQREIQIRQIIPDISDIQIKKILTFQNKKITRSTYFITRRCVWKVWWSTSNVAFESKL